MNPLLSGISRYFRRPRIFRCKTRAQRKTRRERLCLEVLEDRLAPATLTTLASFYPDGGGTTPFGGMVEDSHGNLFGTTSAGGVYDAGTVFEVAAGSGTVTTLASFDGPNGWDPTGDLVMDSQGNLYGTTYGGGASYGQRGSWDRGEGTVFELANGSSTITDLVSMYYYYNSPDDNGYPLGAGPLSGLYEDSHGNLFGTTTAGGVAGTNSDGSPIVGEGTVFEIASGTHAFTQLAVFSPDEL